MRNFRLSLIALGALALSGCTTLQSAINTYGAVTGTSISSGRAITYDDGLRTIQDSATAYLNSCVAEKSNTGICGYGDQVYSDLLILRADRKALLSYASANSSVPIGIGGVLSLTETAVTNIQSVLANAGISTPTLNP